MKKSVLLCSILVILIAVFVAARGLTDDQQNVTKIATPVCKIGEKRCLSKTLQECDGTTFVTKKMCALSEVCDTEKGCHARQQTIDPFDKVSKDFYYWRYHECRQGQIVCNQRFIRRCEKNKWVQSTCATNEYCHPTKGCLAKEGLTRLKKRELTLPNVPKVKRLHYG